jgi:predicted ArsR family transcriptional regulator
MSSVVPSDRTILDLLRQHDQLHIADFEAALGVTATAVRQRLNRLMDQGFIEKRKDPAAVGRGRPQHCYGLTPAGRRKTGTNFADLAIVLWQELRAVAEPTVRRGLLPRIAARLATAYRGSVDGRNLRERMEALVALFAQRQVPMAIEFGATDLPVLTVLACPYPELAEQDRGLCAMERMMVSEVLGLPVTLDSCRLDGGRCCTFATHPSGGDARQNGLPAG